MIKVTYVDVAFQGQILANDIPNGTTFLGKIGSTSARLFLKRWQYIVPLDGTFEDIWSNATKESTLTVRDYQPVNVEVRVTRIQP